MAAGHPGDILDLDRLEQSAGSDPGMRDELIGLYLADTGAKVPRLLAAADAEELELMGRVAHGLKGASAALGCIEAARAFQQLEELGRNGETEHLEEALGAAQAAWRRACERLRELAA